MSWFKLKRPMDENSNVDYGDIVNAKQALRQLGYYQPPFGNEVGAWVDPPLFDGIRKFQKDNRLKLDGLMKPGGPTERAINKRLAFNDTVSENGSSQEAGVLERLKQSGGAAMDLLGNYRDMRDANVKDSDKYFHCKGNCEAARRGAAGESAAEGISNMREWWDQHIKGYPA